MRAVGQAGRASVAAAAIGLGIACIAAPARAQDEEESPAVAAAEAPDEEVIPVRGRDQRRPMPDYDGLPDPPPSPEEALIWIPRVLLSPLWFVTELVIRQPLGAFLTFAERERWHLFLYDLFTWDDRRAGIVPTPFYDFGLLPSIGLYFFWNDVGAPGHQLRAHVGFGGVDWLRGTVRDRVLLADGVELSARVDAWRRPDRPFQGIGPRSVQGDRARYRQDSLDATIDLTVRPFGRSRVTIVAGVRAVELDANGYEPSGADPSLEAAVAAGVYNELPPGFAGLFAYRQRIEAILDTRDPRPRGGHGVRLEALAEQAFDLGAPVARRWLRYGGGAAAFVDAGAERVFSLHVRAAFADPMGPEPVPFTELVTLGGNLLDMPGYVPGALVDRSSIAATLRYRWPVWVWLDASLFVATGNVFGEHLRDLDPSRLRLSWGFFLQSVGDRDAGMRLGIAFGTRSFDRGADVESVRFVIGGSLGF